MPSSADIARLRSMVAAIWLGMLIGVSFIATPVKFQAAGLDLPVALDIGRLTFAVFAHVEWVLAVVLVLLLTAAASHASRWRRVAMAAVVVGVAIQALWLLPALNARVEAIIAGQMPGASLHHLLYAGVEAAKVVGLLLLGLPSRRTECAGSPARSDQGWRSKPVLAKHGVKRLFKTR